MPGKFSPATLAQYSTEPRLVPQKDAAGCRFSAYCIPCESFFCSPPSARDGASIPALTDVGIAVCFPRPIGGGATAQLTVGGADALLDA